MIIMTAAFILVWSACIKIGLSTTMFRRETSLIPLATGILILLAAIVFGIASFDASNPFEEIIPGYSFIVLSVLSFGSASVSGILVGRGIGNFSS